MFGTGCSCWLYFTLEREMFSHQHMVCCCKLWFDLRILMYWDLAEEKCVRHIEECPVPSSEHFGVLLQTYISQHQTAIGLLFITTQSTCSHSHSNEQRKSLVITWGIKLSQSCCVMTHDDKSDIKKIFITQQAHVQRPIPIRALLFFFPLM